MKTANKVRSFPIGRPADTIPQVLREVESAGCRALYGPEFGEARVKDPTNPELQRWHNVLTGIYTGKTKRGSRVVVFAHVPHTLTNPNNIETAINYGLFNYGLFNGAAATPEVAKEIPRLLDLEGQGVFVVPHEHWKKIKSGLYTLDQALEQPTLALTTAFLGGLQKAEKYLQDYHSKIIGSKIKIFKAEDQDGTARLAVFSYDIYGSKVGISASSSLYGDGRFAAVQLAEGAATKKTENPLEELVGKGTQVPGSNIYVIHVQSRQKLLQR